MDLIFIFLHIVTLLNCNPCLGDKFLLETIYGFPEIFQFLKYSILIMLLANVILRKGWYSCFALLFVIIILFWDDLYQIHSLAAFYFTNVFGLQDYFWFRGQDLGYLIYVLGLGSAMAFIVYIGYSKTPEDRKNSYGNITLLIMLFLFFALILDILSHWIFDIMWLQQLITVLEEGGEMISLSLLVTYCFHVGIVND